MQFTDFKMISRYAISAILCLILAGGAAAESFCGANCVSARAGDGLKLDSTGALALAGGEALIADGATLSGVTSGKLYVANNGSGPMSFTLPSVDHVIESGLHFCISAASKSAANEITMNRNDSDVISYDANSPVTAYTFFALGKGAVNICVRLADGNNVGAGNIGMWMVHAVSTQKTGPSDLSSYFTTAIDDGDAGAADTWDFTAGQFHTSTLSENAIFTCTDPALVLHVAVRLCQDGSGGNSVTFCGNMKFPGGPPTVTATASACDVVSCIYDPGTDEYACSIAADVQ